MKSIEKNRKQQFTALPISIKLIEFGLIILGVTLWGCMWALQLSDEYIPV